MKYLGFVRKNFDDPKFPVFTIGDLRASLGLMGIGNAYLLRILNYLSRRGEITRVGRGVYTFHDDITVVGFAYEPFYYGLENALTLRKFWDQNTNPIVVTWRDVRRGVRRFGDGSYTVKHLDKRLFFGHELVRYYDLWIPVSDAEKTLIDLVYFRHQISEDALALLRKSIDRKKLDAYLKRYSRIVRKRVLEIARKPKPSLPNQDLKRRRAPS